MNASGSYQSSKFSLRMCISLQQTKSGVIEEFIEDVKKCCDKILNNTEYTYATKTVCDFT